jgi:hypothetical protein
VNQPQGDLVTDFPLRPKPAGFPVGGAQPQQQPAGADSQQPSQQQAQQPAGTEQPPVNQRKADVSTDLPIRPYAGESAVGGTWQQQHPGISGDSSETSEAGGRG